MQSSELIKVLEQNGWVLMRTRGSHCIFKHAYVRNLVSVPHPRKDVAFGTVRSIFKTAGLDWRAITQ